MRRLRVVLLLLGLALAVPVMLLVARARQGEILERDTRHQAVAARAFDEMERQLSDLLAREEARPFEAYRALTGGEASLPGNVPAFVIGHFQIDPDGRLHASPGSDVGEVARATLTRDFAGSRRGAPPATTLLRDAKDDSAYAASPPSVAPSEDAYDVLSQLNLGRASRAERKQRVRQEPLSQVYGEAQEGFAPAGAWKKERDEAERADGRSSAPSEPEVGTPAALPETGRVRVALDPMVGRPVGEHRLLLYRTALVGELGYRQGVLLDRTALAAWLEARMPRSLDGLARLRFDAPEGDTAWAPPEYRVFAHRFAEPFDAMSAQLALAPLPTRTASSAFSIYALAGLLVLVAAGGLLAVDRMVAVVLSFAERRNRFVASVSHELKTPLTAIRMYAEMLRDGLVNDDAKRDEYYGTITDESERLSRLIDNVLEFSRLERGQREIELRVGSAPAVLEEAARKLRPHAERQGFTLRVEVQPDLPAACFDRDALMQVIFNLVDNAMKYARPAAAAEVVLEARAEGERVLVGVRDFGPGVDPRHLRRIFEPFYRAECELTGTAKGSGIGLALVRELGQAMGASVSGANAVGGGFRVMLAFDPARA